MTDPQNHVEYVLTADFDIDAGPTMAYQYPTSIQGDRYLMAELMLPDGSHSRTQDWTVFFLYKRVGQNSLEYSISDENEKQMASKYYVLNLCQTEFTDTVKRGAKVRSMCLITPHPYFHVFKPLLILALDGYIKNPGIDYLQLLYNAINSIDLSKMPSLSTSERLVLASSENTNLFSEKFEQALSQGTERIEGHGNEPSYYIDLKNQGVVDRISIRDTHFFESRVDFNGMKIPVKIPTDFFPESVGDFSLRKLISTLISIQGKKFEHLHPQLTIYGANTPPLIVLLNALLTQKRILFVGLNSASSDVAEHVLAACSLVSGGILRGFITHAFPYTDLSKVDDLLQSPGYIAGVKNPAFERHAGWWDVLVDAEQLTIKISPEIGTPAKQAQQNGTAGSSTINPDDLYFVDELQKMMANHYGETTIRTHCRHYLKRFIRIATNYEEHRYGFTNLWPSSETSSSSEFKVVPGYGYTWQTEQQRLTDFNIYSPVIEGWKQSRSYQCYIEDQKKYSWERPPKYVVDFEYHLDRLRLQRLTYEESGFIFNTLCSHTKDYDDINKLLSASSLGNLFYLALGLFHRDSSVRTMTVLLLQRIENHAAGKVFFKNMSQFQRLAFKRLQSELNQKEQSNSPVNGTFKVQEQRVDRLDGTPF